MKQLRRLTSTIAGSFEWIISQVENHEAIVQSALKEVQEHHAQACVHYKRVVKDGKKIRQTILNHQDNRNLWIDRARQKVSTGEEGKALECVKRVKHLEREMAELEQQACQHHSLEQQLAQDLSIIEKRIQELKRQRNLLRARESRAQALRLTGEHNTDLFQEIDTLFERWDTQVSIYEIRGGTTSIHEDSLEEEFQLQETEQELRASLAEILATTD